MLSPEALSTILAEFQEELGDRESTEIQSTEDWTAEIAAFVEARLPACSDEAA